MRSGLITMLAAILLTALLSSCAKPPSVTFSAVDFGATEWQEVVRRAAGTAVHFGMWAGDEERNRYFQSGVTERLQREFHITLRIVPATDTAELVNKMLNEKRAGRSKGGSLDALWINGENFRTAKDAGILWGPFSGWIPNVALYDPISLSRDFGTAIEGLEAPWQRSEYVFAYDPVKVSAPPKSVPALRSWIEQHPGRFTYIAPPDFTGSAFIRHLLVYFGGSSADFQTFDEARYQKAAAATMQFLNEIKPYLWRRGETYPPTLQELNRMFANSEVDFTMSYGPSFASAKMARGEFPQTVRTFVLDSGALGNYSYLAIPFNASNPPGALVLINYLMSFDNMLEQSKRLGYPQPHQLERLTAAQRAIVNAVPRGPATLSDEELAARFIPEPDAQYLTRLEQDWLAKVLRQ